MLFFLTLEVALLVALVTGFPKSTPLDVHPYTSEVYRIPLERRSASSNSERARNTIGNEQGMTATRLVSHHAVIQQLARVTSKYRMTMQAYERNTGYPHPLSFSNSFSMGPLEKRDANGDVPLTNQGQELWYGTVQLGTPPRAFTVDFDTGSSDTFVPHSLCEVTCEGHKKYDPDQSTSSTDHNLPFFLAYGTGETFGEQCQDDVNISGIPIQNQTFGAAFVYSPEFSKNPTPLSSGFSPDGLCGLAFPQIAQLDGYTVIQRLKSRLTEPRLGFKLSAQEGESELRIGATNTSLYKNDTLTWTPVIQEGYWQVLMKGLSRSDGEVSVATDGFAIIDTGTTLIVTAEDIAEFYYKGIPGAKHHLQGDFAYWTIPCDTIHTTVPTLTFGERPFAVPPWAWNLGPSDDNSTSCIAGLVASRGFNFTIVGDVFLQAVYTIFDFGSEPRVGFAELT